MIGAVAMVAVETWRMVIFFTIFGAFPLVGIAMSIAILVSLRRGRTEVREGLAGVKDAVISLPNQTYTMRHADAAPQQPPPRAA